jgi:hypothetical protein
MGGKNKIRNLADLSEETTRVRKSIRKKEKECSDDVNRIVASISPVKVITEIAGKILTSAPALYTVFSILRTVFGKRKAD